MVRRNLYISSVKGQTYRFQVLQFRFDIDSQTFDSIPVGLSVFMLCYSCFEYTLSIHCEYIVVLGSQNMRLLLTRP